MRLRIALPIVTALLALAAFAGCGSGGSTSSTATSSAERTATAQRQAPGEKQPAGEKQPPAAKRKPPKNPRRQQAAEGHPTPGAKAVAPGVPVVKGGDNSIPEFGTEGEEGPRRQAAANLTAYLSALGAGEWEKACELASTEFGEELVKLLENAQGTDKSPKDCTEALALLGAKAPKSALQVAPPAEVLSFRVEGSYAYLIYRDAKGQAMFVAMAGDGGQWKVNVLRPEPFSEPTQGSSQ